MLVGAHVSAAKGVWNAPENAAALGLDTFQIFSRPPQGGPAPDLSTSHVVKFKAAMKKHGFKDAVWAKPLFVSGESKAGAIPDPVRLW